MLMMKKRRNKRIGNTIQHQARVRVKTVIQTLNHDYTTSITIVICGT